jgi:hypothetical protein
LARHRDGAGWRRRAPADGHLECRSWLFHRNAHALERSNRNRSCGCHRDRDRSCRCHRDLNRDRDRDNDPDGNADAGSN